VLISFTLELLGGSRPFENEAKILEAGAQYRLQYGSENLTSTSGRNKKTVHVGIPNFLLHVVIHLLSYDKTLLFLLLLLLLLLSMLVGKRSINILVIIWVYFVTLEEILFLKF
jgi:hypothetical protein